MVHLPPDAAAAIDALVDAYEDARQRQGAAQLTDFLPPPNHPEYLAVAAELIRVDMEYSWEHGKKATVESYQTLLPDVLADPGTLASIAFEEYRLRALAGQAVDSGEYRRRFAVPTDDWPEFGPAHAQSPSNTAAPEDGGALDEAWDDALELADNVADFPAAGETFAGFELECELGRGAFARVFRARQSELADRPVVLKIATGKSLEPQHLARLQHTNVAPIYSVHQAGPFTAVCMPYFGARTLGDVTRALAGEAPLPTSGAALLSTVQAAGDATRSPLDSRQPIAAAASSVAGEQRPADELQRRSYVDAVVDLTRQVAEGLAHAHARGIVHRDLKPANILLTDDARPLLLDFNLSENVVVNGRPSLMVGGTLPYMSPEQLEAVRAGGRVDGRSDLYSLGVIFYELLAGQRPFADRHGSFEQVIAQMQADRRHSPPDIRTKNPAVSPAVQSIVTRCLAPRAAERYQSADHLVEDLRRQLNDLPLQFAANTSLGERVSKWSRRHPRATSGGSIGAIAAAALAAVAVVGVDWSAERRYEQFLAALPTARAALSVAEPDPQLIEHGLAVGEAALASYNVATDDRWQRRPRVWFLSQQQANTLRTGVGELSFLMAEAAARAAVAANDETAGTVAAHWHEIAAAAFGDDPPAALAAQRATLDRLAQASGDVRQREAEQVSATDAAPATLDILDLRLTASRLLADREFRAALPYLEALRDRAPQDAAAWLMLGNAYAALADRSRAEVCYDAASSLLSDAGSYVAILNRGLLRLETHDYQLASDDFDEVLRRQPGLVCGFLNRGLARAGLGQHKAAIDDFSQALELGATQTRVYFLRARCRQALGDVAQAKSDYETGLKLTPTDALSWIARGIARMQADPTAALADFRQALALAPHSVVALQNIVYVTADRLAQPDAARAALDEILTIQPDHPGALAGRAVLSARAGQRDEALADVARLLQVSDGPIELFQAACALSLLSAGHPEDEAQAARYLARAILAAPGLAVRARTDPDLANLRQSEGFESLLATAASARQGAAPPGDQTP